MEQVGKSLIESPIGKLLALCAFSVSGITALAQQKPAQHPIPQAQSHVATRNDAALGQIMAANDITLLGDTSHGAWTWVNDVREPTIYAYVASDDFLDQAKKAGVNAIAVELPDFLQPTIDNFVHKLDAAKNQDEKAEAGNAFVDTLDGYYPNIISKIFAWRDVVQNAHERGIIVIAADQTNPTTALQTKYEQEARESYEQAHGPIGNQRVSNQTILDEYAKKEPVKAHDYLNNIETLHGSEAYNLKVINTAVLGAMRHMPIGLNGYAERPKIVEVIGSGHLPMTLKAIAKGFNDTKVGAVNLHPDRPTLEFGISQVTRELKTNPEIPNADYKTIPNFLIDTGQMAQANAIKAPVAAPAALK